MGTDPRICPAKEGGDLRCFMTVCVRSINSINDGDNFENGNIATTWLEGTMTATIGNGNLSVTTTIALSWK